MKQPPCLPLFIKQTSEGNRNHNLFQALNHLRRFNQKITTEELTNEGMVLNKCLDNPLGVKEIEIIVQHVTNRQYKSSCKKFNQQCQNCNHGSNRKPYNEYKKGYWKTIQKNNTIIQKLTNGVKTYPWDIEDTTLMNETQKKDVLELREFKGMNPIIDTVLKLRGIKIGDEALKEYKEYLRS